MPGSIIFFVTTVFCVVRTPFFGCTDLIGWCLVILGVVTFFLLPSFVNRLMHDYKNKLSPLNSWMLIGMGLLSMTMIRIGIPHGQFGLDAGLIILRWGWPAAYVAGHVYGLWTIDKGLNSSSTPIWIHTLFIMTVHAMVLVCVCALFYGCRF